MGPKVLSFDMYLYIEGYLRDATQYGISGCMNKTRDS